MRQTLSFSEKLGEILFPSLRERRARLERALDDDRLTGMANRAAFEKACATAEADREILFIVLDLNNFGLVNKTLGHAFGDEILWAIASEIKRACFAYKARSFRYGGDEFVVLAGECFADALRDSIERRVGKFEFDNFTVSISGTTGKTFAEADAALQKRKKRMKGDVQV